MDETALTCWMRAACGARPVQIGIFSSAQIATAPSMERAKVVADAHSTLAGRANWPSPTGTWRFIGYQVVVPTETCMFKKCFN